MEWRLLWRLRQYSTVVVWGLFAWQLTIRMSHWHKQMVDGAERLISCHWRAFLSAFSHSQLIQKSAPSTICWCQCDIRIITGVESTLAPPTILNSGCMGLVCLATDYGKNDACMHASSSLSCTGVPLSWDMDRSKNPRTNSSVPGRHGRKSLKFLKKRPDFLF